MCRRGLRALARGRQSARRAALRERVELLWCRARAGASSGQASRAARRWAPRVLRRPPPAPQGSVRRRRCELIPSAAPRPCSGPFNVSIHLRVGILRQAVHQRVAVEQSPRRVSAEPRRKTAQVPLPSLRWTQAHEIVTVGIPLLSDALQLLLLCVVSGEISPPERLTPPRVGAVRIEAVPTFTEARRRASPGEESPAWTTSELRELVCVPMASSASKITDVASSRRQGTRHCEIHDSAPITTASMRSTETASSSPATRSRVQQEPHTSRLRCVCSRPRTAPVERGDVVRASSATSAVGSRMPLTSAQAGGGRAPAAGGDDATMEGSCGAHVRCGRPDSWTCTSWACVEDGAAMPQGFVMRSGTSLTLNGEPYLFTGINIYNANNTGLLVSVQYRNDLGESCARIAAVRPRAFGRGFPRSRLRPAPGIGARSIHARVAAAHDIKVIVTLANQWRAATASTAAR